MKRYYCAVPGVEAFWEVVYFREKWWFHPRRLARPRLRPTAATFIAWRRPTHRLAIDQNESIASVTRFSDAYFVVPECTVKRSTGRRLRPLPSALWPKPRDFRRVFPDCSDRALYTPAAQCIPLADVPTDAISGAISREKGGQFEPW